MPGGTQGGQPEDDRVEVIAAVRGDGQHSNAAGDPRDEAAIQGIFKAGMVLSAEVLPRVSGEARHHVEVAVESLDAAVSEIRRSAFDAGEAQDPGRLTLAPVEPCDAGGDGGGN